MNSFRQFVCITAALLAGALLPLAFSPYDLPFMAMLSLILFLQILRSLAPSKSALAGYAFGWGYFGHGVYWVYFSIHHFAHAPLWLAVIIMLGMVAILALYTALFAYLMNRFFKQNAVIRYVLVMPSLWVGLEALRGVLFTGFPWISLGFSQIDTALSGWAPIFGVLGVSWFVVLSVGAVLLFLTATVKKHKVLAVSILSISWLSGFMLDKVEWTRPMGSPIKVALVQGNIPQEIKWQRSFYQKNLDIYFQMTRQQQDVDLIVWPETAIPAFFHHVKDSFIPKVKNEAERQKSDIVLGLPVMPEGDSLYFNGLYSVRYPERFYFKRHLVPLGEYMPLKPFSTVILNFLQIPMSDFSAGEKEQVLLQGAGYPFASSICYEDVFQQTSLEGLPQAAYLVNVSNDTWFGETIAPYQHLQMARMRALESGRYLLRSTNTGLTAIVDPAGQIIGQAPMFKRVTLNGEIVPLQGATPFVKGGWWLILAIAFSMIAFGFFKRDGKT